MSAGGALVRLARIGEWEDAVDRNPDRAVIEQPCDFRLSNPSGWLLRP
jgi:hypothetical protein